MLPNEDLLDDLIECPCPCQHCGKWFELDEGRGSEKWYPDTVICRDCFDIEEKEIETDEEIEDLKNTYENAKYDLEHSIKRLKELGIDIVRDEKDNV